MLPHDTHQKNTLWWAALTILIIGSTFAYLFSINKVDSIHQSAMRISIALSVVGAGICVILATADRWFK